MAVENWIDTLCTVWETVDNGKGGKVRSYNVFSKAEFPESINVFPCAITIPRNPLIQYSVSGPCIEVWEGITEFHLFPGAQKVNLPEVIKYFAKIRNVAAANMTLGGLVSYFILRQDEVSIQGPVSLQYGDEAEHWGLVVNWIVKENTTGDFTISQ